MIKNAFSYVTRKGLKSLILFLIILSMSTLGLVSVSTKSASNKAAEKTFSDITSSFTFEINRETNYGTPRGGGNLQNKDIEKIAKIEGIKNYVKRINSVADLVGHDIVKTDKIMINYSGEKAKNFSKAVMLTGVNDSSKDSKFISEAFKLIEGRHIASSDSNKVLIHKDFAQKNNLHVGDKIKLKSNLFDADNEKRANELVEVEVKGIFDGHNKGAVNIAQELYENNLITDTKVAAKVYGNTEKTAPYQDATFFVKGNQNLDKIMKKAQKLDIDWNQYNLIKSSANYPALQQSISGIYAIANQLFIGALLFVGVALSLLLFLWINARKKEIAILISVGFSKIKIFGQFLTELLLITIPAIISSYFLSLFIGDSISNTILKKVTGNIGSQLEKQMSETNLGIGAEADGFNKTISSLDFAISSKAIIYVTLFMIIVLIISLTIATFSILRKKPKELLVDIK